MQESTNFKNSSFEEIHIKKEDELFDLSPSTLAMTRAQSAIISQPDDLTQDSSTLETASRMKENRNMRFASMRALTKNSLFVIPKVETSNPIQEGDSEELKRRESIEYDTGSEYRRQLTDPSSNTRTVKAETLMEFCSRPEQRHCLSLDKLPSLVMHSSHSYTSYCSPNPSIISTLPSLTELIQEKADPIYRIQGNFSDYYTELETIGEGTSGTVKRCMNLVSEEFAVKIVNYKCDDELETLITREFKNHRKLHHKNIVEVYELYIDCKKGKIYTIMEYVRCSEMPEILQKIGGRFEEEVAALIFKQILMAVIYLHSHGVCHRDIKPGNILVSEDGSVVKIVDFNVSKFSEGESKPIYTALSKSNYKMWTYTGTIAFSAPEVLNDTEYSEGVDMWGAGCVLYIMLCGQQPFEGEYVHDLVDKITEAKPEFSDHLWKDISADAKHLIINLLQKNYKDRFCALQALSHPWIVEVGHVCNEYSPSKREFRQQIPGHLPEPKSSLTKFTIRKRGEKLISPQKNIRSKSKDRND